MKDLIFEEQLWCHIGEKVIHEKLIIIKWADNGQITIVMVLINNNIRPVAQKGYGAIAHEAKPNGLLIPDTWGPRV